MQNPTPHPWAWTRDWRDAAVLGAAFAFSLLIGTAAAVSWPWEPTTITETAIMEWP